MNVTLFISFSAMCTSNKVEDEEYVQMKKRSDNRKQNQFCHLYKEKVYYLSKKNNQIITTGYRLDKNGKFVFCIRFDDFRYSDFLTLTLFQFVSLIKDLRSMIYDVEQNKFLDEIDGFIKFSFKDINVPKVQIQVDASYSVPNLFELVLSNYEKLETSSIVTDRKTIKRVIEYEADIINTIELLDDTPSSFLLQSFVSKCVDHLINEKTIIDTNKIYTEVKSIYKTPFQSEVFLKFWPQIYKLIESQLITGVAEPEYAKVD